MKVYFPSYYNNFACIADKCRHSCCVGWEIYLDGQTIARYNALPRGEREEIFAHIDGEEMQIRLTGDERCPFLDGSGLCRLISHYGEGYISEICKEHPRFYHKIGERTEGGIGASCEEAARIILTSDGYRDFTEIERQSLDIPEETELDTFAERVEIYEILADRSIPYRERIVKIKEKYNLPSSLHTASEWQEIFSETELLSESHRALISVGKTADEKYSLYTERFLAYLIYRHVSVADSCDNLRARVGFAILLTEMLENYLAQGEPSESEIIEAARIISEEIEYSEDNTASLILEIESLI
ncbi:MAG: flagellin lysine-N-methylase [Clostridia bacterium]|nr:flagellin lysine-N-methylase [Clostridia bacterium]